MSPHPSGAQWERMAEMYLIERGAKLVQRNYRAPGGEIDLIVTMDGATVFVEVKQRSTRLKGAPGEAVDRRKQARISKAALMYLKANKLLDTKVRFDVVEILGDEIRHLKSAFPYTTMGR